MAYVITHWLGDDEHPASTDALGPLFDELEIADEEHGSVCVTHESEWCLSVGRSGRAYWENVEDRNGTPRHLDRISRDEFIELGKAVAAGDLGRVEQEDWQPGY